MNACHPLASVWQAFAGVNACQREEPLKGGSYLPRGTRPNHPRWSPAR